MVRLLFKNMTILTLIFAILTPLTALFGRLFMTDVLAAVVERTALQPAPFTSGPNRYVALIDASRPVVFRKSLPVTEIRAIHLRSQPGLHVVLTTAHFVGRSLRQKLYALDLQTNAVHLLYEVDYGTQATSEANYLLKFPPTGDYLAFTSRADKHFLTANLKTGEVFRLLEDTTKVYAVTWSPDGTQLAFNLDGILVVIRADGTARRDFPQAGGKRFLPRWLADEQHIILEGLPVANPGQVDMIHNETGKRSPYDLASVVIPEDSNTPETQTANSSAASYYVEWSNGTTRLGMRWPETRRGYYLTRPDEYVSSHFVRVTSTP